jgi:hypothetical protein
LLALIALLLAFYASTFFQAATLRLEDPPLTTYAD